MKYVKSLPRYAVYDGKDLFGASLFHTSYRRYKKFETIGLEVRHKVIQSFSLHEKY